MVTDPIADYLTRIRNAQLAGHTIVDIPASNMKKKLTEILHENGYILKFKFEEDGPQGTIKIALKYNPETKKELAIHRPKLFISGHSHILKVMYDPASECVHMNPGAAGKQGWHKVKTLIKFVIDGNDIRDASVIELGKR